VRRKKRKARQSTPARVSEGVNNLGVVFVEKKKLPVPGSQIVHNYTRKTVITNLGQNRKKEDSSQKTFLRRTTDIHGKNSFHLLLTPSNPDP